MHVALGRVDVRDHGIDGTVAVRGKRRAISASRTDAVDALRQSEGRIVRRAVELRHHPLFRRTAGKGGIDDLAEAAAAHPGFAQKQIKNCADYWRDDDDDDPG